MTSPKQILILGAGELGTSFLPHLSALPNTHITLAVRTISKYTHLSTSNITLISLDTTSSSSNLIGIFSNYDIVISCTGFGQPLGTVTKLAHEILNAGKVRKDAGKAKLWFFPWQWGVDYDITKDGDGVMPLFGEQLEVRNLLRQKATESHVKWTIVSTGIFMSMLFASSWGIVERQGEQTTTRALRDWDHKITATDVGDIGKVLARIVAGDVFGEDCILYVGGDTVSYAEIADIVEQTLGKEVKREVWSLPYLGSELEKEPTDELRKYRIVFAGEGVWWDKEHTVNHKLQIDVTTVGNFARQLFS